MSAINFKILRNLEDSKNFHSYIPIVEKKVTWKPIKLYQVRYIIIISVRPAGIAVTVTT